MKFQAQRSEYVFQVKTFLFSGSFLIQSYGCFKENTFNFIGFMKTDLFVNVTFGSCFMLLLLMLSLISTMHITLRVRVRKLYLKNIHSEQSIIFLSPWMKIGLLYPNA